MKLRMKVLAGLATLLAYSSSWAAATPAECQEALGNMKDLGNVAEMLGESYGYAIMPTIGKGGIGIGGAGGSGCVYAGGVHTGNTSMGQITIGFQLGGQAFTQIILFKNKETYDSFVSGEFEFGAQATAVALTYGASAEAGTKGSSSSAGETKGAGAWKRGMAVFTLAKGGLMYEATIGGQKFSYESL
jgi:lipid-binding SYLF domain-containing protein